MEGFDGEPGAMEPGEPGDRSDVKEGELPSRRISRMSENIFTSFFWFLVSGSLS